MLTIAKNQLKINLQATLGLRMISLIVSFSSTAAAAANSTVVPASLRAGYENKFKWYTTAQLSAQEPAATQQMAVASPNKELEWKSAPNVPVEQVSQTNMDASDDKVPPSKPNLDDVIVGAKFGSLGYGVEAAKMINDNLGWRTNLQYAGVDGGQTVSGIRYDTNVDWITAGALLDYYPVDDSGFRLTGGSYFGKNTVDFDATPSASTQIGNNTYTTGQIGTVKGKIKTNSVSPYAGLGYNSFHRDIDDWNASIDLGVKFGGNPDVDLVATGGGVTDTDLTVESQRIRDDSDLLKFYPVASVSISRKF